MLASLALAVQISAPQLVLPPVEGGRYTLGEPVGWKVVGLEPRDVVRVEMIRVESKITQKGSEWVPMDVKVRAWVDFRADERGVVNIDTAKPLRGTYRKPDPAGLLWSGRIEPHTPNPKEKAGFLKVIATRNGRRIGEARPLFREGAPGVKIEEVKGEVRGVFAMPKGKGKVPTVIYLHGSEGSSASGAQTNAARFAARGIACFALHYSARPWVNLEGVPTDAVNVPIEILSQVRDWLSKQERVDLNRLALYGVSKGAEFSLVAGSKFDWINTIISVVPSDVVFEGYGRDVTPEENASSWSWKGEPLPYVPYIKKYFEANPTHQATQWHRQCLIDAGEARVRAARIPVENITADTLIIAGDMDEVWPSGDMGKKVVERMKAANRRVRGLIFPKANHQISGPGAFPAWLYANDPLRPLDANPIDVSEATRIAWSESIRVLRRMR